MGHDLYFLPRQFRIAPGRTLTVALHNGDSFPDSEVAARPEYLAGAAALTKAGSAPLERLRVEDKALVAEVTPTGAGTVMLVANSRPRTLVMKPAAFESYLKEEGLDHVVRWRAAHGESAQPGKERYSKYVKSILIAGEPDDTFSRVLGTPVEIVPESNPGLAKPGSLLPIRLLFRGQPAAGVQIEAAWASPDGRTKRGAIGRTDAEGRLRVPIEAAGRWRLHALVMERCAEPTVADWESFWSSLTFETAGDDAPSPLPPSR